MRPSSIFDVTNPRWFETELGREGIIRVSTDYRKSWTDLKIISYLAPRELRLGMLLCSPSFFFRERHIHLVVIER